MSTIAITPSAPSAHSVAPILTPAMLALAGTMVSSMGSFYLLLSAIPAHAAALGGASAAGLSTGVLMAATILGEVLAPRVIARLGRRRALAAALVTMALPCVATFSASLPLLLITCATRGLGLGVLLVAACGLAAQLAPASRRAEALGAFGVASAIPAIVGVPLGPWALAGLGATWTAALAAGLAFAALLTVGALPRLPAAGRDRGHATPLRAAGAAIWPVTSLAVGAIVVGAAITFLPLAHPEIGQGTTMFALLVQGLAAAYARWAAGRAVDRRGPKAAMIGATALAIAGAACLAAPGAFAVLMGMAISGIAFGVLQSATLSRMLGQAAPAEVDGVGALWNGAYDAGLGVGGLAFGGLASALGYAPSFLVSAALLAGLAGFVFHRFERRGISC